MRISAATFGFFYESSLEDSFRRISELGFGHLELTVGFPHLEAEGPVEDAARLCNELSRKYGVEISSVNAAELNLISPIREMRETSRNITAWSAEFSKLVGAPVFNLIPGRRSLFMPMPDGVADELLEEQLDHIVPVAEDAEVVVALETAPFGFHPFVESLVRVLESRGSDALGITVDAANVLTAGGDPVQQVQAAGKWLKLAHFSGSFGDRLAHTSFLEGDVELAPYLQELRRVGYADPVVYELANGQDAGEILHAEREALRQQGFEIAEQGGSAR